MSRTVQEEPEEDNTSLIEDYAKVRSVLARITGLRLMMVASAVVAGISALIVWFYEFIIQVAALNPNALSVSLSYAIFSTIPFMALMGYFHYRVGKHIRRLSYGKYENVLELD
jgi:hypothetical protein